MGFAQLPNDLKNVICSIAYGAKWETIKNDINTCIQIKQMQLHPLFLRELVWSNRTHNFEVSPLAIFEPIQTFRGTWQVIFDWHVVRECLWRLDFRRRHVKSLMSRREWVDCFEESWENIEMFSDYFCFLVYTRVPCFKPIWKDIGFQCLRGYGRSFGHLSVRDILVSEI